MRFEKIKFGGKPLIGVYYKSYTIAKIRRIGGHYNLIICNVKWTKFKIINKIIRLYLIIRFF